MDTIYLTNAQIEALYKLTRAKRNRPNRGVQVRGTALDGASVTLDSVLSRDGELYHAIIDGDGATSGWEC